MTINGNNASLASASRVFDISGSVTVTISGLTIANGEAVVTQPLGADGGGGILNEAGATLNLDNCVLSNNEAVLSPAITPTIIQGGVYGDVCGGGLLNEGTANLVGTTVDGNQALGGGSYTEPLGGSTGGGIDNWDGGTLSVTNSTITNNKAISAADPEGATYPYFALGGGIANHSGSITAADGSVYGNSSPSTVTVTNSTVANNEATGGTGVYSQGGGIFSTNGTFALPFSLTVLTISNCTISGNRAVGGDNGSGPSEFSAANGGGIASFVGTLTVNNSTLSDNVAQGGNGSTPTVGTMADNVSAPATGAGQAGGLLNYAGLGTVSNCTLIDNKAIGGNTTGTGPVAIANGGGISNWGAALTPFGIAGVTANLLTVSNSTLIGNEAIAGQGSGPASSAALWGFAAGGGIDDAFSGTATLNNCTLVGNQAIGSSGADGGTGFGGGISLGFSYFFNTSGAPVVDNSTLQMSNSTLLGNVAQGGNGGATGTGGDGHGGGLAINLGSSATVTNSTIDFNLALGGFGGAGPGQGIGGGVYNDGMFTKDHLTAVDFNFASFSNNDIFSV